MLNYKGYSGHCEIDFEAGIILGRVTGIRDVITFKAAAVPDVQEIQRAFEEAIDDYIEFCEEAGKLPEFPDDFDESVLTAFPPEWVKSAFDLVEGVEVDLEQPLNDE